MSRDLHFSLDSLPERYRSQAMLQLSSGSSQGGRSEGVKGVCGKGGGSPLHIDGGGIPPLNPGNGVAKVKRKTGVRPPISMAKPQEMSAPESAFNRDFLNGRGRYEAITLNLPGKIKYTPDFLVTEEDRPGIIALIEVKGSFHLQSHQRAATAFKSATAAFPEFVFVWAEQQRTPSLWKIAAFQNGGQIGRTFLGTHEDFDNFEFKPKKTNP